MSRRLPALSDRLAAVAGLVPSGAPVADICADHAYLAIALVASGRVPSALAIDIAEAPVRLARANIAAADRTLQVSARRGDGLGALSGGEARCVVLAGVGGAAIIRLLERDSATERGVDTLVLQPNKKAAQVRRWLSDNGWRIDEEALVEERGRFFCVFRAVRGEQALDRADELLGPVLRRRGGPVFERFALHTRAWISERATARAAAGRGSHDPDLAALDAA